MRTLVALFLGPLFAITPPSSMPDASTGQIGGKVAVLVWPIVASRGGTIDEFLPAEGCRVVLAPWTDLRSESEYPCGKWFQPAEGRYRIWIERPGGQITSNTALLNFAPSPFAGSGQRILMSTVAGGTVAIDPSVTLPPNAEVRFINFDSCCVNKPLSHPFDRRVAPPDRLHRGVLMPPGRVLAGIFDHTTNDALAIAPLASVEPGKAVTVAPRAPAKGTDVFAALIRANVRSSPDVDTVRVTLGGRKPDILFDGSDRIYAVWRGVEAPVAKLEVESATCMLAPRDVKLPPGRVVTIREDLKPLPSLHVSVLAPPHAFDGETPRIEVRDPSRVEPLRTEPVTPDLTLHALPAAPLDVVLNAGPWQFLRRVDLTDGRDSQVVFDLHPILVTGTVFQGRDAVPHAVVEFEADGGRWTRSTADDGGRYTATLWRPDDAYTLQVTVPGRKGPPYPEMFIPIRDSRTLDIHVPNTDYRVHLIDDVTGRPIEGGTVSAGNVWVTPTGEQQTVAIRSTSDADGIATLVPLHPGTLQIRARAANYLDSAAVEAGPVASDDSRGDIEVRMRPVGETTTVTFRLADGQPASGAEVLAVAATVGTRPPLWRGTADADGHLAIPRSVRGALLLVRSRAAASAIRTFDRDEFVLQPPAPPVRVQLAADTPVMFWLDGMRVTGPAAAFLSWSAGGSDGTSVWTAENLPTQPLRVLASRRVQSAEWLAGLHDGSATTIAYPWPAMIVVQPAQ